MIDLKSPVLSHALSPITPFWALCNHVSPNDLSKKANGSLHVFEKHGRQCRDKKEIMGSWDDSKWDKKSCKLLPRDSAANIRESFIG